MSGHQEPGAAAAADRAAFQALAKLLAIIGTRLQTQGDAACQIAMLAPRAEQLASQASAFARVRGSAREAAAALAADLGVFLKDTIKLADHAAREAAVSRDAGAVLKVQAAELKAVELAFSGANDKALIRARLRAVLGTLAAIPARLQAMTAVAADVAALGARARGMGDRVSELNAGNPGAAAMEIRRGLLDFAGAAATIAAAMSADAERIRQCIAGMSGCAANLGSPAAAAQARSEATAIGRIPAVVSRGAARQGSQHPDQPVGGMSWGGGSTPPR
jgi:hypothetical protein